jgi:predicted nucleotide-binding protein (sugar kinase/HSP70/actin superfamily)
MLGKNPVFSLYAWYNAWKYHRKEQTFSCQCPTSRRRIGLIGHSYIIHDRQISMNIVDKLNKFGFEVITPEMVSLCQASAATNSLSKKIFWSSSHHMAGAALALIQGAQPVDGLIIITSFACGPDALIGELIKRHAQQHSIPCMLLTIDEHTAEAGFVTRLEAFTDMLTRRERSC